MTDPDSLLTRLRRRLAARLTPFPDRGESWCVSCALNGGRTLIMTADAGPDHAREHTAAGEQVTIQSAWPVNPDVSKGSWPQVAAVILVVIAIALLISLAFIP